MKINSTISEINLHQWNDLFNHSSTANFFQSKQCYDFHASLSFVEPFVFSVSEDDLLKGVVVGYLQKDGGKVKQFFSRRAIVNGGPLLADDISEEALEELLKECARVLKDKAIYIEFRNFNDYSRYKGAFVRSGFRYEAHYNFHIDTSSIEIVESNLGKSRKRDIRTSLRDGAEVVENPSIEEVKDYYELLSHLYKTKVKTPLFPIEFFEKLYEQSFSKFLLIRYNEKIVGGTVCVCMKDNTVYEWFACGEDGVYKNIYPSTLATYLGIRYAAENGYKRFDMMGAGKPDETYGVRDFKMKFGGKLVEYGRFVNISKPALYKVGRGGGDSYKKIPNISVIGADDFDVNQWDELVSSHPFGGVFQSPDIYRAYLNTPNHTPGIIALVVNGKLEGILLYDIISQRRFKCFSSRSIIQGGPIVRGNNPKYVEMILDEYNRQIRGRAIYTQFRNFYEALIFNNEFRKNGYRFSSHLNFLIDLTQDEESLYNNIGKGRRKQIVKAQNNQLMVNALTLEVITEEDIEEGYKVIQTVYKRIKLPLADKELIVNAWKEGLLIMFVVKKEEKVLGCRFALSYKDVLFGWFAGSYQWAYPLFSNDLLIWETLKWGKENGYSIFDYGGAGEPNKPYGVRDFKAQMGGKLVNYGRYEKVHKLLLYNFGKIAMRVLKSI